MSTWWVMHLLGYGDGDGGSRFGRINERSGMGGSGIDVAEDIVEKRELDWGDGRLTVEDKGLGELAGSSTVVADVADDLNEDVRVVEERLAINLGDVGLAVVVAEGKNGLVDLLLAVVDGRM